MKTKLLSIVLVCLIINTASSKCDSDFENDRAKRTVGVFFKSFVNAFHTQRQPAPNVVSFKPSRQQNPQSIKADILSSSKTLLLKKQNIFKPSITTKAPVIEVITKIPPVSSPPKIVESISQVPTNQPELHHPNLPIAPPIDSFTNLNPPAGQQPNLKAQILIFPFPGHQGSKTPFTGFGLQPHLSSGISPLNYQAEFYLQPALGGGPNNHFSGPYSPDNGWHDVDEILSKGVKTPNIKGDNAEIGIGEHTTLKDIEFNNYAPEIKSETGGPKFNERPSSKGPLAYHNDKYQDNIEDLSRNRYFENYNQEQFQYLPTHPLFSPQITDSVFNANTNSKNHVDVQPKNLRDDKIQRLPKVVDEACKKLSPEVLRKLKLVPQAVTPQNNQDRPRVNDAGVLQIRNWSENTVLDFIPQRAVGSKLKENSQQQKNDHQPNYNHKNVQNHIQYPEQHYNPYPQLGDHFSEHQFLYLPGSEQVHHSQPSNIHHQAKSHQPENIYENIHIPKQDDYYDNYEHVRFQDDQYQTKIGKLPSSNYIQPGNHHHHSSSSYHQELSAYGLPSEPTEISGSHPNGYYHIKRSYT